MELKGTSKSRSEVSSEVQTFLTHLSNQNMANQLLDCQFFIPHPKYSEGHGDPDGGILAASACGFFFFDNT